MQFCSCSARLAPVVVPVFFVITLTALVSNVSAQSLSSLVFALKPNKNPEAMREEKAALEAFLADRLKSRVEVIIPTSNAVIVEGFLNGTVDLAFLSGMELLVARARKAADLLLAVESDGRTFYESLWLVPVDSPHKSIADLKGRPVAFASKTSTSGALIPHADLVRRGLIGKAAPPEDFFGKGNVFYGAGYVSAVERVLEGQAEAAAVSDYVFDRDKHLSPEQKARLRVLQRQGPVPTHLIAVRAGLAPSDRELLANILLGINSDDQPDHARLRERIFGGRFKMVDPSSHLAPLAEALDLTGNTELLIGNPSK